MSLKKRGNEPYQIKGIDALFGEQPIALTAAEFILISQISLPQQQPRRYFDPQAMQELIESVKTHGILQPLLVRCKGDEQYELVAGERRYRAALSAGLDEVPVVIKELTDDEALQIALLENLHREDLNPVEETEGILALIALKLGKSQESVLTLLHQAAHPERSSVDNVIHTQEWQLILEVFTFVGKFTPESFRTNRLPLLNLPQEILVALRSGKIAYTKARAIAKVKNTQERQAILDTAIRENLSLSQIRECISNLTGDNNITDDNQRVTLKNRMDTAYRLVKKSKVWEDPKQQKRLEKLLAELEKLASGG